MTAAPALAALAARPAAPPPLDRPLVLVGLMGAGKSSVGRRLAAVLGLPFRDADAAIEERFGLTVAEIFERHGEPTFRAAERDVIAALCADGPMVAATGGGAFMDPDTRAVIRARARSMWLRAELEVLARRCARRDSRPLLRGRDPAEALAELMALRYPVYAEADLVVDSVDGPIERTVEAALVALAGTR